MRVLLRRILPVVTNLVAAVRVFRNRAYHSHLSMRCVACGVVSKLRAFALFFFQCGLEHAQGCKGRVGWRWRCRFGGPGGLARPLSSSCGSSIRLVALLFGPAAGKRALGSGAGPLCFPWLPHVKPFRHRCGNLAAVSSAATSSTAAVPLSGASVVGSDTTGAGSGPGCICSGPASTGPV